MFFLSNGLPLVANHCSKRSTEPLGTPLKLIQILGDGNCLFRALSYDVTARQVYYTRVRAQIINHMNRQLLSQRSDGLKQSPHVR